jgi:DMSO/TMAO reductase YedYZ molybdopterin-dependent catalytic subunit
VDGAGVSLQELQLAARNHGMPLEALRYDVTPVGLHYLLIHYDIPVVGTDWRLEIGGRVERPAALRLDDLRGRPSVTARITMECAGNGRTGLEPHITSQPWVLEAVGTAEWTGVPLADLLDQVGVLDDAVEIVFEGLDRGLEGGEDEHQYARSLTVDQAREDGLLLAYDLNGAPLPPQHGYPLRLVVPGWYGMTSVKWLRSITAVSEPFTGYQQAHAYRWRDHEDDPGTPVTRMAPRSLMAPPGIPDFMSRDRRVRRGEPVELEGRAWSGWAPIASVAVSTDGGFTWQDARLDPPDGPYAWRRWTFGWTPQREGRVELCCRAVDDLGNRQPDAPRWNVGGYGNNAVQRVAVDVIA